MDSAKFLLHEPLLRKNHTDCAHSCSNGAHEAHSHFDARKGDKKVLLIAFSATSAMMIVQFIYALLSNSLALLSDTLHMFSDAFALALSFLAILATQKLQSPQKTFGYFRLEILVAFINGLTILLAAGFVSYEAIQKLLNPSEIDAKTMLIVACVGFLVNVFVGVLMFKGANLDNINMKSAFFHLLSDLLSSVGVIIGGVIVYFTKFYYIDTILGLIIALLLLRWALILIKQSVNVLLESSPIDMQKVSQQILINKEVEQILDLHISQITHKMFVATMHIRINKENLNEFESLSKKIASTLYEKFDIGHCTIEPSWS